MRIENRKQKVVKLEAEKHLRKKQCQSYTNSKKHSGLIFIIFNDETLNAFPQTENKDVCIHCYSTFY